MASDRSLWTATPAPVTGSWPVVDGTPTLHVDLDRPDAGWPEAHPGIHDADSGHQAHRIVASFTLGHAEHAVLHLAYAAERCPCPDLEVVLDGIHHSLHHLAVERPDRTRTGDPGPTSGHGTFRVPLPAAWLAPGRHELTLRPGRTRGHRCAPHRQRAPRPPPGLRQLAPRRSRHRSPLRQHHRRTHLDRDPSLGAPDGRRGRIRGHVQPPPRSYRRQRRSTPGLAGAPAGPDGSEVLAHFADHYSQLRFIAADPRSVAGGVNGLERYPERYERPDHLPEIGLRDGDGLPVGLRHLPTGRELLDSRAAFALGELIPRWTHSPRQGIPYSQRAHCSTWEACPTAGFP